MAPSPQIIVKSNDEDALPHPGTYDCTSAEEGDDRLVSHMHYEEDPDAGPEPKSGPLERTEPAPISPSWHNIAAPLFYVSTFAIFGTVLRLYVGRFFGLDCLQKDQGDAETDFLSPLSSLICITSDGRTERGGALFIDLPANMLGSFFRGLLNPLENDPSTPLVWLRRDHPLQKDTWLHLGLKIGFCGSLTTFASWNAQMVVMMDGTDTIYGPQVAAALFGYLIGMIGAITSYAAGTHVARCFHKSDPLLEQRQRLTDVSVSCPVLHRRTAVVLGVTCILLVAGLFLGDFYSHLPLYRELWMAALLSPLGAVLRWNLMKWNVASKGGFPWGTWTANFTASLVSSFVAALSTFVVVMSEDSWAFPALRAVGTGFAGSFSTVSSLVHEIAIMESVRLAYGYVLATIVPSMLLSLLIYVPIARFW